MGCACNGVASAPHGSSARVLKHPITRIAQAMMIHISLCRFGMGMQVCTAPVFSTCIFAFLLVTQVATACTHANGVRISRYIQIYETSRSAHKENLSTEDDAHESLKSLC